MSDELTRYRVKCLTCDDAIGEITILPGNRVRYDLLKGLLSTRMRSDGYWGFECQNCGNYSLVAKDEVAEVIELSPNLNEVTLTMLQDVIAITDTVVVESDDGLEVDGFLLTEIT
jgi:hypothetical protein